jgi:hypothetical protein
MTDPTSGTPSDAATADHLGQLIDLMAQTLQIPLHPEHRPGVIANFARSAEIAQLVMEFPLPELQEMAPIFEP